MRRMRGGKLNRNNIEREQNLAKLAGSVVKFNGMVRENHSSTQVSYIHRLTGLLESGDMNTKVDSTEGE